MACSTSKKGNYNKAYFAKRAKIAKEIQKNNPGMPYNKALEYATKVIRGKEGK